MGQAIEQGACEPLGAEHAGPFAENARSRAFARLLAKLMPALPHFANRPCSERAVRRRGPLEASCERQDDDDDQNNAK
jgi:hypothetical protein